MAREPLSIANLFRYVYLHSPLTDENRSAIIRGLYFLKYIVILVLMFFCFKFIYGSWLEYYNGKPSSSMEFVSNLNLDLPEISICSRREQNKGREKV